MIINPLGISRGGEITDFGRLTNHLVIHGQQQVNSAAAKREGYSNIEYNETTSLRG
jgi:hypothetical protein